MGRLLGKTGYAFRQKDADGNVVKQWTRTNLDMKVPVVCVPCNTGWMSRLEDKKAKPAMADMILHGKETSLSSEHIKSIATFAFKQAVIADSALPSGRNPHPFFTTSARRRFAASLAIPNGVQMWLAAFDRDSGIFQTRYLWNWLSRTPSCCVQIY